MVCIVKSINIKWYVEEKTNDLTAILEFEKIDCSNTLPRNNLRFVNKHFI